MVEDVQNKMPNIQKFEVKTAILIDGAFYRERSKMIAGIKSPKERADELERYCFCLLYTSRCV